mmetsp:Transcript_19463/g.73525  ORF Transcript_19463/g.73525 Transcript_19463/m.73525 type:complete len:411 (-) Transcript_19463:448-1680(-)|eukprot:scaffold4039_cov181-Pinguiococcus_pyrenoidosus.AAC.1
MGASLGRYCCCCCSSSPWPSPKSASQVHRLNDKIASYINLPDETKFVESCAYNARYDMDHIYIPLQLKKKAGTRTEGELHIYRAQVGDAGDIQADPFIGPVRLTSSTSSSLTPFGTALTDDGKLWICIYNKNLVIEVDLETHKVLNEVSVYAPNDVCVSGEGDDKVVYVAGGSQWKLSGCCEVTDPTRGKLYTIRRGELPEFQDGFPTLAGVEESGDALFVSLLHEVQRVSPGTDARETVTGETVWQGDDKCCKVWLADNIQRFGENAVIIPAYRTVSKGFTCMCLQCGLIGAIGNCFLQCGTCLCHCERCREAFRDPEVSLKYSIRDTAEPLRILILEEKWGSYQAHHFEVHLTNARSRGAAGKQKKRKYYFDANVTNIMHVNGMLVCVNFQQPRILLLPDGPFREALS